MMNSQQYLDMMKNIQENILNFLEEEAKSEENLQILEDKFNNLKKSGNKYDILSLLHLISKIVNNFHRFPNFFSKIEKLLLIFKDSIKKYFSNSEIFNIFDSNKRILLFLIEQQIIVIDEYIVKKITKTEKYIKAKYPQYFQPEIQPFTNEKWFPKCENSNNKEEENKNKNDWIEEIKKELPDNFYEKRKEGENDSQICELIRKDMISNFIVYVNKNNISLNAKIQQSIYETNSFLLKNQDNEEDGGLSLIEYAVFFGSIQIFNHLRLEGVKLTPSLWLLAIHSQNAEMIHFIEDNHVELKDKSYTQFLYESIKCHHNDIANYFLNTFLQNNEENSNETIIQCLKYYNFAFLNDKSLSKYTNDEYTFCKLCKYDYCALVYKLLENIEIDVNYIEIFNILLI